jgi:hypothetical protein
MTWPPLIVTSLFLMRSIAPTNTVATSAEDYADILANAEHFQAKSPDFFILPAGLDNASINTKHSLN